MTNAIFDNKHSKEYLIYGSIAGLCHILAAWYFLYRSNYRPALVPYIGSIFFMFVIMIYAIKLTKRRPDNDSIGFMLIAGQTTVAVGIIVAMIGSFLLCCFYIPGFLSSGNTPNVLRDVNNSNRLELIFITASFLNGGAGAFISGMIAYAVKPDQTQDQTLNIFEEPAEPKIL